MIRFYLNKAEALYNDPSIFTSGAVYCRLISTTYAFDENDILSEVIPVSSIGVLLSTKTAIVVGSNVVFDASDFDIEDVPANTSYGHLLFYTATEPLFLLSDIEGLPGTSTGGFVSVSFSSGAYKIVTIEPAFTHIEGTHFVYTKDPVPIPDAPADAPTRPAGFISFAESISKALVGKKAMYKDVSLVARAHPLTGDITTVANRDAINQSIRTILLTDSYERPFSSMRVAGNVKAQLFELAGTPMRTMLQKTISVALSNHEPRINVLNVVVQEFPEKHAIGITVSYSIKTVGTQETISIFLERA